MNTYTLNGQWQVVDTKTNNKYDACVPGDIHHDLFKAGLFADPYFSDNSKECLFVKKQDWEYTREFEISAEMLKTHLKMVFEGIDTYSEIFVNDVQVLKTDNMFLGYTIPLNEYVKEGKNSLRVLIKSIEEMSKQFPTEGYFGCFNVPRIFMRKAQCHFSWDWAPNFPAMGIYKDVYILSHTSRMIDKVVIKPNIDGKVSFFVNLDKNYVEEEITSFTGHEDADEEYDNIELFVTVSDGQNSKSMKVQTTGIKNAFTMDIDNPKLWWPRGMGEQNLYTYNIDLLVKGNKVYSKCGEFGIRKVELDTSSINETKFSCALKINDKPVFLKGANWVPINCFTGTITKEDYQKKIEFAQKANFNMLRVWGGGIYESQHFYDACNRAGIMVWQDFQFACADIPDDYPDFMDRVVVEAEYQINRLSNNPSLVMWAGGNEKTGTFGKGKSRGDKTAYYMLRGMVAHLDGTRPYLPSSPFSYSDNGNDLLAGDSHVNSYQTAKKDNNLDNFRDTLKNLEASLASEIAVQGCCRLSSLEKFIPKDKMWPLNDIYDLHFMRNPYDGTGKTFAELQLEASEILFGQSNDVYEFAKKSMALHMEFIKADAEFHRSRKDVCSGSMFWMYSDIWPSGTWAILDYYNVPKASYYSAMRSFKDITPLISRHKDGTVLRVANDTQKKVKGNLDLYVMDEQGNIIEKVEYANVIVKGCNIAKIGFVDEYLKEKTVLCAVFSYGKETVETFYYDKLFKEYKLKTPKIEYNVTYNKVGATVSIVSDSLARMVNIVLDKYENIHLSDNFFDLMPNVTKEIKIQGITKKDKIEVKSYLDKWCN